MRTKSLLLAAALLSFAGSSAMAAVYSVNTVGFVNVSFEAGKFKMVGNPLQTTDNTITALIKNPPEGTLFYKYGATGFSTAAYELGEWDKPALTLAPGEGGFLKTTGAYTLTFVGEVLQTPANLNIQLNPGFQIVSSIIPQSLVLSKPTADSTGPTLDFPASNGDLVYFYRNNSYEIHAYDLGEWDRTGGPIPAVGEAFWVKKVDSKTWARNFTVN